MKVMVPLAEGFEEIEAMAIIDVLRRAGIQVDTVGVVGSVILSAHGIRIMVDFPVMRSMICLKKISRLIGFP